MRQAAPLRAVPAPITDPERLARLDIRRSDRLGGIIHEYQHAALNCTDVIFGRHKAGCSARAAGQALPKCTLVGSVIAGWRGWRGRWRKNRCQLAQIRKA
jgi:hypothetical protein